MSGTGALATGTISATGDATVLAGRDIVLAGASIDAGGQALLAAGRDIDIGTTTLSATQDVSTPDGLNGSRSSATRHLGSSVTAGGNVVSVSGPRHAAERRDGELRVATPIWWPATISR